MATLGTVGLLVYRIWRGASLVARSDLQGHSYEPLTVERATVQGFTLSFCLHCTYLYNHSVAVVLDRKRIAYGHRSRHTGGLHL